MMHDSPTIYDEIRHKLHERGYLPGKIWLIESSGSECIGLDIKWAQMGGHRESERIREIVGKDYLVDFNPNTLEIYIRTPEDNGRF